MSPLPEQTTIPDADAGTPASDGAAGEFAASDEILRLQLDQFEGPFEVLLYLIRSQEIDIFDIPILKVTEQYLQFLDVMREENLDIAGEFLVMAATLIQIKSRMLLPPDTPEEEEEDIEEEDPRLELVEKLLEYRKFRDLSESLALRGERAGDWYPRRAKPVIEPDDDEEDIIDVSFYDLLRAIRAVLKYVTEAYVHNVQGEGSSVEEKISRIEALLEDRDTVTWRDLFDECKTRVEIVCCLLAILELCRMRRLRAHQHNTFGNIRLFSRDPSDETPPTDVAVQEA